MNPSQSLAPGQKVLVKVYNSAKRECDWMPGVFENYVNADDRDHRLNVAMDNGWYVQGAAPECVKAA